MTVRGAGVTRACLHLHAARPVSAAEPRLVRPRLLLAACTLILATATVSCSAGPDQAPVPAPTTQPGTRATADPASGDPTPADSTSTDPESADSTPARPLTRAPDPVAPATVKPVGRTSSATKRVTAPAGTLTGGLRYPDGVKVTVSKITQSTTTGEGPGSINGAPKTTFALRLDNDSSSVVDVSQVVVRLSYGRSPARLAPPVYGTDAADFTGTVPPGKSTAATYAFSIPASKLSRVTLSVDIDARHAPAVLNGSAR